MLRNAGRYWSYEPQREAWRIFDAKGSLGSDRWAIEQANFKDDPQWSDKLPPLVVCPTSYLPNAIEILLGNMASDKIDITSYIGIPPFRGLLLALEGRLTLTSFRTATEANGSIVTRARFRAVHKKMRIVISPRFTACRAYSAEGSIIE